MSATAHKTTSQGSASVKPRGQRNFLGDYDSLFKAMQLDYVDNARYASSGYSGFIGKLYTLNASMFQSPVFCDRTLTQMMLHYLAWYQDPAIQIEVGPGAAWHMRPGLRVQRYEDALYVTAVEGDIVADEDTAPIQVGDRIVRVNGMTLAEIRDEVERTLMTTVEPADSEREDWSLVLSFARHLTLVDPAGVERTVKTGTGTSERDKYLRAAKTATKAAAEKDGEIARPDTTSGEAAPVPVASPCTLAIENDVAIVRPRFDAPGFSEAAAAAVAELAGAPNLRRVVIDLRGLRGGAQEDAYPLVPLVLVPGTLAAPADLFGPAGIVMNCSRRNVDAKLAELERLRQGLADDPQALAELDALAVDLSSMRGRGLQRDMTDCYPEQAFSSAFSASGPIAAAPRVVLLVDRHTGEAAEWLVRAAKSAGYATVMGRATLGSLDNTCPRTVVLDEDFSITIPTAKYIAALEGMATLGRGIAPDVHIPWTPEHLARDVDLEAAMK